MTCSTLAGFITTALITWIGEEKATIDTISKKAAGSAQMSACITGLQAVLTVIGDVINDYGTTDLNTAWAGLRDYKIESLLLAIHNHPLSRDKWGPCGIKGGGQTVFDFFVGYICSRIIFGGFDVVSTAFFNEVYSFSAALTGILFDFVSSNGNYPCPVQCTYPGDITGGGAGMCPDFFSFFCGLG